MANRCSSSIAACAAIGIFLLVGCSPSDDGTRCSVLFEKYWDAREAERDARQEYSAAQTDARNGAEIDPNDYNLASLEAARVERATHLRSACGEDVAVWCEDTLDEIDQENADASAAEESNERLVYIERAKARFREYDRLCY